MEHFGSLQAVIAEAFVFHEIVEFTEHFAELGEQVERTAAITGQSADDIQVLMHALRMTGGSAESAGGTIFKLENNIQKAVDTAGPARQAFEDLGVSMEQLKHDSPQEILEQLAEGYKDTTDKARANADILAAGGRGMRELIPVLSKGKEGFHEFGAQLDETNSKMSEEMVQSFAKSAEGMKLLGSSITGLGVQAFKLLEPAIDMVVTALTSFFEGLSTAIGWVEKLAVVIETDLAGGFTVLMEGLETLVIYVTGAFERMYIAAQSNIAKINAILSAAGKAMREVASGDISTAVVTIREGWDKTGEISKKAAIEMEGLRTPREVSAASEKHEQADWPRDRDFS